MPNSSSPFEKDSFFQNNSMPIVVFDATTKIVCINKAVTKLFKYTPIEMVGKKISDFAKKKDFQLEIDKIKSLISGKITNYKIERKYLSKTNEILHLAIDVTIINNSQNGTFYFAGSFSEIEKLTVQNEYELELNDLKVVLQKSPVIQWVRDVKKDEILYKNNSLFNYLGYKNSDLNNLTEKEFILSKTIDTDSYIEKSDSFDHSFEFSILSKKNEIYWFIKKCISLNLDAKSEANQSFGMCIDITNQKNAEAKIIKQEALLNKISTSIPQFIFVLNYETDEMEFSNSRCKKILGYTDKEFGEIEKRKIYHPDFYASMEKFVIKLKDENFIGHAGVDVKLKHKTKGYRWYRIESKIFERDENQKIKKSLESISDIDDLKRNEIKIHEQQKLFKKVTSLMPEFSYIEDLESSISIYNNNKSYKLFGFKPNEFFSLNMDEFIHPNSLILHKKLHKKIHNSKSRKNYEIDLLLKHKTKGYRWFKHRVTVFERNSENLPIKLLKSLEDIHEHKLNEISSKEQKLFIETISSKMPFSVYVSDIISGKILYSNVTKINILGYTNEEYTQNIMDIIHPNDIQRVIEFAQETKTNNLKKNFELEFLLKHKTKGFRWYRTKSTVFKRNEKNETTQFIEIIEDIHAEKIKTLKINDQNILLDNITNSIPYYLNVINIIDDSYIFSNFENRKILGYTKKEYQIAKCDIVYPEHKLILDSLLAKLSIPNQNNREEKIEYEFLIKHKTDGYVWVNLKLNVLKRSEDGTILQILEILEDVDASKKKNEKLIEQENFISDVSTNLPSTISILDVINKELIYSNTVEKNVMGYSDTEWIENAKDLIPEEFHKEIRENKKLVLKSNINETIEEEVLVKHKTLGFRWYKFKTKVFKRNSKNKPIQILEIIEDTHSSKSNAIKINEQRILLNSVTHSITSYIYLFNTEKNEYTFTNFSERNILGYKQDYFLNNSPKFIHKSFLKQIEAFQKVINPTKNNQKTRDEYESEILFKHANRGYVWVKIIIKIIKRNSEGKAVEILELIEDINDSKQKTIKIVEQQKFISNISESIPQYLTVYDLRTGKCIYTNYEKELIFGYTKVEYLNKSNTIVHPDYKEKTIELGIKMNNEVFLDDVYSIDFPLLHKTLGYKWVRLKVVITERDKNGKPIQALETLENIDQNKKVFLQVKEQQNFIEEVASIFPNLILVTNLLDDKIIYSNFGNRKYLGYSESEWIEQGRSIIYENHKEEYFKSFNALIKQKKKQTINIELLLKNKEGDYIWVALNTRIFKFDNDGTPIQIMSTFTDINDSKLAFNKIFEQQTFIHHISDSIPQYLSVWNVNTNECFYTNFENKLIFGYSRDEFIQNGSNFVHPDYTHIISQLGKDIRNFDDEDEFDQELLLEHKTRGFIWVHLKVVVIEREENGDASQTLEIMEDINHNKLSFNKVNEQQDFIQKVNSTIPSIIQVIDLEKQEVVYSNFENRIFLGYNKIQWEKEKTDIINKSHFSDLLEEFQFLYKDSEKKAVNKEVLIRDKNNKWVWVQLRVKPFAFDENGIPIQIMSIFIDINERKELYIKLENSQKELDNQVARLEEQLAKNIELERFASIASHDLKEPLRTIRNYAQILNATNRENLDLEGKLLIDYIENSTKRMSLLVQDILTFSKIDTGGSVFSLIDINEILDIVLEDLSELIKKKKIVIIKDNDFPFLNADQNQIRQVFQNLISNAIKFSIEEFSEVYINVTKQETHYLFSVKDNGIGIPNAELKNIFGIFKKLHNKTEFDGQGIGLSICKRVLDRHEGKIWVESMLGFGATFFFTLPINKN